jgi:hypothetical protein
MFGRAPKVAAAKVAAKQTPSPPPPPPPSSSSSTSTNSASTASVSSSSPPSPAVVRAPRSRGSAYSFVVSTQIPDKELVYLNHIYVAAADFGPYAIASHRRLSH